MESTRPRIIASKLFHRQSGIFKRHSICIQCVPLGAQYDDGLGNGISHAPKLFLILTEFSFSALQVVNVSIRSIPVDNVARFVAQWLSPKQKPSIHSVESTQPSLDFARLARGQKAEPLICYFLQVLRVNGILPPPAANHFKRLARIFMPL